MAQLTSLIFELSLLERLAVSLSLVQDASSVDTLVADLDSLLQQLISQIPSLYAGASASFFDFGAAFQQVRLAVAVDREATLSKMWTCLPYAGGPKYIKSFNACFDSPKFLGICSSISTLAFY